MLVVSRQAGETMMVGDAIRVTVLSITDTYATLAIDVDEDDSTIHHKQMLSPNETIQILPEVAVTVVDVRGNKVRLGFVYPAELPVHRGELYDGNSGSKPTPQKVHDALCRNTVVLQVDQELRLGQKLTATPTDIDPTGVRLLVRGELLGGADDGVWVNEAKEVGVGSVLSLGALVTLSLVSADQGKAMFHVITPSHVKVGVE